jgi:hypothetical protein
MLATLDMISCRFRASDAGVTFGVISLLCPRRSLLGLVHLRLLVGSKLRYVANSSLRKVRRYSVDGDEK